MVWVVKVGERGRIVVGGDYCVYGCWCVKACIYVDVGVCMRGCVVHGRLGVCLVVCMWAHECVCALVWQRIS